MIRIVTTVCALAFAGYVVAGPAFAEPKADSKTKTVDESCPIQASGKKLAGAAKGSFLKKCCEGQAMQRKLAGAAKKSFLTKCEMG
jgi:hypothetical protein